MEAKGTQFTHYTRDTGGSRPMHVVEAIQGDKKVGEMAWNAGKRSISISVNPEHQRQGIGTAMWQEGHRLASENPRIPKPKHSPDRTEAGDAWARSVGGPLPRAAR